MQSKGSELAKRVDLENRHDEYMKKKYELKRLKDTKTGMKEKNIKKQVEVDG